MPPSRLRRWLLAGALLLPLPAAAQRVEFVWSGALEPQSVRIVAGLRSATDSVRLALTKGEAFTDSLFFSDRRRPDPGSRTARFTVDGLEPGTRYRYAVEVGGVLDTLRAGRFETPPEGPFSFKLIFAGCAETGSERPVFEVIRRQRPLFFLHLGDFHYENIDATRPEPYRTAYRHVLRSPVQARLYRDVPVAYIWDDHDYGPNNSDERAPGRETARQVYQEMVPHYPLAAGEGDVPIYQAFTMGRVRFVITDLRSARDTYRRWITEPRSIMGAEQKAWFKEELRRAREAGQVVAWVSTVPWIDDDDEDADTWGAFAAERRELADYIAELDVPLVMLAGDAHMVAVDDGTNSNYSQEPGRAFPVIHSAAMDQHGSLKGGPYSHGAFPVPTVFPPHNGQWVMMDVEDEGGPILCMRWRGYRTNWDRARTRPLVRYSRCFDVPAVQEPAPRTPALPATDEELEGTEEEGAGAGEGVPSGRR